MSDKIDLKAPIWAKLGNYPFWPARYADENESNHILSYKRANNEVCVFFLGSNNLGWVMPQNIVPLDRASLARDPSCKTKNKFFHLGLEMASKMLLNLPGSESQKSVPVAEPFGEGDLGFCQACSMSSEHGVIIVCDGCEHEYHLSCCTPKLIRPPKGNWYCHNCQSHKSTSGPPGIPSSYNQPDFMSVGSNGSRPRGRPKKSNKLLNLDEQESDLDCSSEDSDEYSYSDDAIKVSTAGRKKRWNKKKLKVKRRTSSRVSGNWRDSDLLPGLDSIRKKRGKGCEGRPKSSQEEKSKAGGCGYDDEKETNGDGYSTSTSWSNRGGVGVGKGEKRRKKRNANFRKVKRSQTDNRNSDCSLPEGVQLEGKECFVCKLPLYVKNRLLKNTVVCCSVTTCQNLYHVNCIRHSLSSTSGGFVCPRHHCVSCHAKDPKSGGSNLVRSVESQRLNDAPSWWHCSTCPVGFCLKHTPATRSEAQQCINCLSPRAHVKIAIGLERAWSKAANSDIGVAFLRPVMPETWGFEEDGSPHDLLEVIERIRSLKYDSRSQYTKDMLGLAQRVKHAGAQSACGWGRTVDCAFAALLRDAGFGDSKEALEAEIEIQSRARSKSRLNDYGVSWRKECMTQAKPEALDSVPIETLAFQLSPYEFPVRTLAQWSVYLSKLSFELNGPEEAFGSEYEISWVYGEKTKDFVDLEAEEKGENDSYSEEQELALAVNVLREMPRKSDRQNNRTAEGGKPSEFIEALKVQQSEIKETMNRNALIQSKWENIQERGKIDENAINFGNLSALDEQYLANTHLKAVVAHLESKIAEKRACKAGTQ